VTADRVGFFREMAERCETRSTRRIDSVRVSFAGSIFLNRWTVSSPWTWSAAPGSPSDRSSSGSAKGKRSGSGSTSPRR